VFLQSTGLRSRDVPGLSSAEHMSTLLLLLPLLPLLLLPCSH
jgi:hypothetical protein